MSENFRDSVFSCGGKQPISMHSGKRYDNILIHKIRDKVFSRKLSKQYYFKMVDFDPTLENRSQ